MTLQLLKMSSDVRGRSGEVLDVARQALKPWMVGSAVLNDPKATIVGIHLRPLPGSVIEIRQRYADLVAKFQAKVAQLQDAVVIAADDSDPVDAMQSIYVRLPSQLE